MIIGLIAFNFHYDIPELLERAGGSVKRALVMHHAGFGPAEADRRLAEADGWVRKALEKPGA